MAVDIATLGLVVDTRQVRTAQQDLRRLEGQAGGTERATNRFATGTVAAFQRVNTASRTLHAQVGSLKTLILGFGAVTIGSRLLREFEQLETTFTRMETLAGVSSDQIGRFRQEVFSLASATAKPASELAEALFFITSSGQQGQRALDVLTASAQAATVGLGSTVQVADAVTSALNAYATSNLRAKDATAILLAAVREGKSEASELSSAIGAVLPVASNLGVGFDEVAASLAAMSQLGSSASESVTALRGILTQILKPTDDTQRVAKALGLSFGEIRERLREDGLLDTLLLLKDRIGDNEAAMARLFPDVQGLVGVLSLVGENAEQTKGIFDRLAKTTGGTLHVVFNKAVAGRGFAVTSAMEALNQEITKFSANAVPTILPIIQKINENFQETLVIVAAIGAGLAALRFGPLAGALAALGGALSAEALLAQQRKGLAAANASALPASATAFTGGVQRPFVRSSLGTPTVPGAGGGGGTLLDDDEERARKRASDMLADMKEQRAEAELSIGVLQARLRGEDQLAREFETQLAVRQQISAEARASNPEEAAALEHKIRLNRELTRTYEENRQKAEEYALSITNNLGSAFDRYIESIGRAGEETAELGDIIKEFARSALLDLASVTFKQNVTDPLKGSIATVLTSVLSSAAGGGNVGFGPTNAVFASGGMVRGPGSSRSDSITARLSNGEFVVNAAATSRHRGLLESINSYASGGYVRRHKPRYDEAPLGGPRSSAAAGGRGGGFASGGMVGRDTVPMRHLPASVVASAPRYHTGLMPDEFTSILKRGEGVFTPEQMKAMGGGGVLDELAKTISARMDRFERDMRPGASDMATQQIAVPPSLLDRLPRYYGIKADDKGSRADAMLDVLRRTEQKFAQQRESRLAASQGGGGGGFSAFGQANSAFASGGIAGHDRAPTRMDRLEQSGITALLSSLISGGSGGDLGRASAMVRGPGSGRSDSIAARLSNGEFVVNAASTSRHRGLLESINSYADGGYVPRDRPRYDPAILERPFRAPASGPRGAGGAGGVGDTYVTVNAPISAPGADPQAAKIISDRVDRLEREFPTRAVLAIKQAQSRRQI